MKIFRSFVNMALILLSALVMSVYAQEAEGSAGGIGSFDIDKVYEDAVRDDDSALTAGAAGIAGMTRKPENYALVLLRIIGYLAVITLVIFAMAWGIRKFGVAGVSRVGGGNNMDIIETLYFGQNRGAALVRVGDTVYLLGHTPDNIVLLEKIEGDKAVDFIASSNKGGASIMSFKDAFNNFMGKMKRA